MILAGDLNVRVGRLMPSGAHLGGQLGLDNCGEDNGNRLLHLRADHGLYLDTQNAGLPIGALPP